MVAQEGFQQDTGISDEEIRSPDLGIQVPLIPPAALGLGLCDINRIMTPDQIAELEQDLADMVRARNNVPEGWNTDRIAD